MSLGQFFFKFRGFTPVPIVLIVIIFAEPTMPSFLSGVLVMLLGEFIRYSGVAYAGGATRTRNVGAQRLVTNGPFAFVRNPLYIGNILMYCGAAIIANVWQPWLTLGVLLYFFIQYYFIIRLEEDKLVEIFGDAYREYCQNAPRIIPRITPAASVNPVKADWVGGIKSEKSTFLSFIAILILMALKMIYF